jgi:hypothetical protein
MNEASNEVPSVGRLVRFRFLPFLLSLLAVVRVNAGDSVCASRPEELRANSELLKLQDYFPEHSVSGYVNETAGSYFEVTVTNPSDAKYILTFYTSGFLDLYGVMRSGPAKFCVDDGELTVHSMGQAQKIRFQAERLLLGEGGPRKSFTRGTMPPKLVKLHRPIGSGGSRTSEKGFANPSQREEY